MGVRLGTPTTLALGRLHVETLGSFHRVWKVWVPDSLHVWWGDRGVHLFAFPWSVERESKP